MTYCSISRVPLSIHLSVLLKKIHNNFLNYLLSSPYSISQHYLFLINIWKIFSSWFSCYFLVLLTTFHSSIVIHRFISFSWGLPPFILSLPPTRSRTWPLLHLHLLFLLSLPLLYVWTIHLFYFCTFWNLPWVFNAWRRLELLVIRRMLLILVKCRHQIGFILISC